MIVAVIAVAVTATAIPIWYISFAASTSTSKTTVVHIIITVVTTTIVLGRFRPREYHETRKGYRNPHHALGSDWNMKQDAGTHYRKNPSRAIQCRVMDDRNTRQQERRRQIVTGKCQSVSDRPQQIVF